LGFEPGTPQALISPQNHAVEGRTTAQLQEWNLAFADGLFKQKSAGPQTVADR
jgi:hypothetical protein